MAAGLNDACPYHRPFSDDFAECPAFRRVRFLALDMQYRPLSTVNTCAHLEARSVPGREASFYAHCLIGDAAARKAWARQIEAGRLARIRELSRVTGEATREASIAMWEAKAAQLRAVREGSSEAAAARQVARAARAYEAQARRVLESYREELEHLGLEHEAVLDLIHEAVQDWAARTTGYENYRPSPDLLKRFPAPVQAFLSPNVQG
jgi:hypothetical protein